MVTVMTGKYHCPVTYKVFNENTHIVAVKTTGNVYCMEVSSRVWLHHMLLSGDVWATGSGETEPEASEYERSSDR